jgi:hypothetical protein
VHCDDDVRSYLHFCRTELRRRRPRKHDHASLARRSRNLLIAPRSRDRTTPFHTDCDDYTNQHDPPPQSPRLTPQHRPTRRPPRSTTPTERENPQRLGLPIITRTPLVRETSTELIVKPGYHHSRSGRSNRRLPIPHSTLARHARREWSSCCRILRTRIRTRLRADRMAGERRRLRGR